MNAHKKEREKKTGKKKKGRMKEQQTISVRSSSCLCAPVCIKL